MMMTIISNWQVRPIAELPSGGDNDPFFFFSSLIFGTHTCALTRHVIIFFLYREDTDRWLLYAKQDPRLKIRRWRSASQRG